MHAAQILDDIAAQAASVAPAIAPAHQRMRGRAKVALAQRRGTTRLVDLSQSGAAKAMLPRVHGSDPEVVMLNTAGGLTGGDHLQYRLELGPGARATATTQTAERAYRSLPQSVPARLDVEIEVGPGGHLAWLPQETILFEDAALHRNTRISLAADASCLTCECVVLGRQAMGETLTRLRFGDWREIRRDGIPIYVDPFALSGADLRRLEGSATFGAGRAMASVVLVSPDAEDRLEPLRRVLKTAPDTVEAAASAWEGRLVLRGLSKNAQHLRQLLAAVLAQLGGDLPRVWQM